MILKKALILISLLLLITMSTFSYTSSIKDIDYSLKETDIQSQGAILINAKSGQVLFEKNAHLQLYPASTTKLLTALIIAENLDLNDEVVIDKESPFTIGARIYIREGEIFTVDQLLNALLVESANDVANALAVHYSGSIKNFSEIMNKKAISLGAVNSNFVNPSGLHHGNHYTTAYDLALISKAAYENEIIREIVKKYTYAINPTNKVDETRYMKSSNKFLYSQDNNYLLDYKGEKIYAKYDLVNGMKTGYTDEANNCLVTSASMEDKTLIAVVLNATGRHSFIDSRELIDYGFYHLTNKAYYEKGDIVKSIEINNFKKSKVNLIAADELTVLLDQNYDVSKLSTKKELIDFELPIQSGDTLGHFIVYYDDQEISRVDLLSDIKVDNSLLLSDETYAIEEESQINYMGILFGFIKFIIAFLIWRSIITLIRINMEKRR